MSGCGNDAGVRPFRIAELTGLVEVFGWNYIGCLPSFPFRNLTVATVLIYFTSVLCRVIFFGQSHLGAGYARPAPATFGSGTLTARA